MSAPAQTRRSAVAKALALAAGWGAVLCGVRGVFVHRIDTRPAQFFRFAIGGALVHDLVAAPAAIALAWLGSRVLPRSARAPVAAALFATAAITLFTWPELRGYGRALHNPSSLPHNYARNLTWVLGAVWSAAVLAVVRHVVRARRPTDNAG